MQTRRDESCHLPAKHWRQLMAVLRTLVVDDETALLSILRRVLSAMDCDMVGAATLREGLRCALDEEFDIILLDNHFPEGHCDSIVPCIVSSRPDTPVVIITANPSDEHVGRALSYGAREVLAKPFSMGQLAELIERYCAFSVRVPEAMKVA